MITLRSYILTRYIEGDIHYNNSERIPAQSKLYVTRNVPKPSTPTRNLTIATDNDRQVAGRGTP